MARRTATAVRHPAWLKAWLGDGDEDRRRVRLRALSDLKEAGFAAKSVDGHGVLVGEMAKGSRLDVAVLDFPWANVDVAAPLALADAIGSAAGQRAFLLHLRRELPPQVDVAAVQRAVALWIAAIERGEWEGREAVYEDGDVAVDLVLLPTGGRLVLRPALSHARLGRVDDALVDLLFSRPGDGVPLGIYIGSPGGWVPSRGFAEQALYGLPVWREVGADGYRAAFRSSGQAVFSDSSFAHVCALWWRGAEGITSWTNPWAPPVSLRLGRSFVALPEPQERLTVMAWNG